MSSSLSNALLLSGGGGGNIPLASMLALQNQGRPPTPPPGSSLPYYAAGSAGVTSPDALQLQQGHPTVPWYRVAGMFQQPAPPPSAPAVSSGGGSSGPAGQLSPAGAALNTATQAGDALNQHNYGNVFSGGPMSGALVGNGQFPSFNDPRLVMDRLATAAQGGDQNAMAAFQQMLAQQNGAGMGSEGGLGSGGNAGSAVAF